jgi:Hsp20/alpha crystallin family
MPMLLADPFDALVQFQRAVDNFRASNWLGTSPSGSGSYPPFNVFAFSLSNRIDQNEISAQLEDGVLTLTLKKAREAQPRRIAIG